jgi:hypothetical protein
MSAGIAWRLKFTGLNRVKGSTMGNNLETNGKLQWLWNIIAIISVGGIIGIGIAWGSVSKQVQVNTVRLDVVEKQIVEMQKIAVQLPLIREENQKAHERIEKAVDSINSTLMNDKLAKSRGAL